MKFTLLDAIAANLVNGGSKAKRDIATTTRNAGVRILPLRRHNMIATLITLVRLSLLALSPRRSILVNFPVYQPSQQAIVRRLSRFHDIIFIIHDIDQERRVEPTQDLDDLKIAKASILTGRLNDAPAARGHVGPAVTMGCWDYLIAAPPPSFDPGNHVMFAGTLAPDKSPWLYASGRSLPLILAGIGLDQSRINSGDRFIGPFDPAAPDAIRHAWGLVWDGTAIDDLQGDTGLYQKYNQPHKFSLYLAQSMPVICHRDAAIAPFVRAHNVGLVVDSLNHVAEAVGTVTQAELSAIESGVGQVRDKIRSGYYLTRSLEELRAGAAKIS